MAHLDYLSKKFVEKLMQEHKPQNSIIVKKIELIEVDNSASILVGLTCGRSDRMIGHFGLKVIYEEDGKEQMRKMVMKIKPHGREIVEMLNSLAQACGGNLAALYNMFKTRTGFQQTHLREQEIYKKLKPSFTPEIFGTSINDEDETYVILMEYLEEVDLLNSAMQPELWTEEHIKEALKQMAEWHASMLSTTADLNMQFWQDVPSVQYMQELKPLWQALLDNAAANFPELYTDERVQLLQGAIYNIPERWGVLAALPKTLIHNDCNPRNSCFKNTNGKKTFCLYDWELSTFHIPQYDVVEFLCFVIDEDSYKLRSDYIEFYRQQLNNFTGKYTDAKVFNYELELAAFDFALHRVGMYMMAHTVSPYPFLPRVLNSFFDTVVKEKQLVS